VPERQAFFIKLVINIYLILLVLIESGY